MRKITWCLTTVLIAAFLPGLAWAGPEKLDAPLRARAVKGNERVQVIIQFAKPPGFSRRPYGWVSGDNGRRNTLRTVVAAQRGSVSREYHSIRGFSAELPAKALDALSRNPLVERISEDWPIQGHMDMVDLALGVSQAQSTYGVDGTGVGVAVIDSGIHPHADFSQADGTGSRIVGWVDLVNGQSSPYDDNGHGTHVAGIIGGNGWSSAGGSHTRTFRGIAPNCNLIGVKALNQYNSGPVSRIISAVQWCIDNRLAYNIRVINLSMGHGVGESASTDPLCAVVRQATEAGIAVVCSAGNRGYGGYGTISVPGNTPEAITVGAIKHLGYSSRSYHRLCGFSSRGPTLIDQYLKPDVVSVGNRVISLRSPNSFLDNLYTWNRVAPTTYGGSGSDPTVYFTLSGTSMATPTVAGCVALMIDREPSLSPATIKGRIVKSAEKVTYVDIYGRGFGYLDIPAALASTDVTASALSPQCTLNGDGTVTVEGESFPINSSIWSLLACLGVNFAWGENNVSGESFVWESEGLTAENYAEGEAEVSGHGED